MSIQKLQPSSVKYKSRFSRLKIKTKLIMATRVEIISNPTIITEIAQAPIHSTGIVTIVENEATEQKIVGLDRIVTIVSTIATMETGKTTTTTTTEIQTI